MTAHNFLHIVIVVGGVSDGFLPNGEQLLALNSKILRILHLFWKRFQAVVEVEISQCHTLFLWRAALGLIKILHCEGEVWTFLFCHICFFSS